MSRNRKDEKAGYRRNCAYRRKGDAWASEKSWGWPTWKISNTAKLLPIYAFSSILQAEDSPPTTSITLALHRLSLYLYLSLSLSLSFSVYKKNNNKKGERKKKKCLFALLGFEWFKYTFASCICFDDLLMFTPSLFHIPNEGFCFKRYMCSFLWPWHSFLSRLGFQTQNPCRIKIKNIK